MMTPMRSQFILCLIFLCTSHLLHSQAREEKKRGRCVVHNDDGSVSVGHVRNHLRHGKWYTSYPDHSRKSFGKYDHGKPTGKHEGFWPNGKQQWTVEYANGVRDGIFITFDSKGDTVESSNYWLGSQVGYHYLRDTVKQTWMRGTLGMSGRTDKWTISTEDSLIVCNYALNKRDGAFRADLYDNRIVQGYYKHDVRDSVWRVSMYDQVMTECWYTHGKKFKTERIFFPNSDSVYCETRYRSPNEASQFTINQKPGVPGKIEWYSNFIVDSIHLYHPNGKLHSRSIYKKCYDGKPVVHVANYVYDENGKLVIKTLSGPNGKDSLRYDYGTSGNVFRHVDFKSGNIHATTLYYMSGNMHVRYVEDSIQVYSIEGKKLKMGTPAYGKVFSQIDSIEKSIPMIPVYDDPDAPSAPYNLSDADGLKMIPPVLPSFPGGTDSLRVFLYKNTKYPDAEREMNITGKVDVQFIVETDGSLTNIKVVKVMPENNRAYQAEALRLVKAMPKWIPGEGAYGPERVLWSLPIPFSMY